MRPKYTTPPDALTAAEVAPADYELPTLAEATVAYEFATLAEATVAYRSQRLQMARQAAMIALLQGELETVTASRDRWQVDCYELGAELDLLREEQVA